MRRCFRTSGSAGWAMWQHLCVLATVMLLPVVSSLAYAGEGMADPAQLGFINPATEVAEQVYWFHDMLLWIISAITAFVLILLVVVMVRFNARANPVPSQNTHNATLEVAWTIIPIILLLVIAVPSFKLLYKEYEFPKADLTIKAIGNQWFWSYEYPDQGNITFDSIMLNDDERAKLVATGEKAPRLLAVDNEVVVPVGKVVHVLITSRDVIHNWTIQAFASKVDAVPGRLTATWFKALREGIYYGQCSELCGKDHAFMPIAVRVVKDDVFNKWIEARKAGGNDADDKARAVIHSALVETGAAASQVAGLAKSAQ